MSEQQAAGAAGPGQQHAPGWYPDPFGRHETRWWDGAQWTEHVRDASGDPEATAVLPADRGEPTSHRIERDEDDEPDHKRRLWLTATFVGLLAFFLGMAVGGNGGSPDPAVEEATASSTGATLEDLDRREADLDTRDKDLIAKKEELDRRESNLETRESVLETQQDDGEGATTIGNGVFEVGDDVQPGRYASDGPEDAELPCTYRVSEDDDAEEIISSEISDGPGAVTLVDGQYFTSEYCQTWTLQGP